MRYANGKLIFSNGREYGGWGVSSRVAMDPDDGEVRYMWDDVDYWGDTAIDDLQPEERVELADFMIAHWERFKNAE